MLTPKAIFWTLAFYAPIPVALTFAGSWLVRRVGASRGVHACGEAFLGLAVTWLGVFALDQVVRHWFKSQPGITQNDWLPLIEFTTFSHEVLNATAIVVGVAAVLTRRREGDES